MSQENVEALKKLWQELMAGDLAAIDLSLVDPDVVYEDDLLPDHSGESYHGHEGLRRAWAQFLEPWETFENDMEWTRDAGNEVVSCHRVRARGKGSGIAGELHYAYVFRFREGKIVHVKSYGEPSEALEAVGLSE
jgi:ketosteroid isomerase-like protein